MLSKEDRWYGAGRPATKLIVESRSMVSSDPRRFVETYEVNKPMTVGRQRDQIMRKVHEKHPDAQLSTMDEGIATFFTHTEMIIASYDDSSRARVDSEFMHTNAGMHGAL